MVENLSVPLDQRVWNECRSLQAAGYEVTVVCPKGVERDVEDQTVLDGVHIHRYRRKMATGGGPLAYVVEYAWAFRQTWSLVRRLGRNRRFEVAQACNPPDILLLAALPLKLRGTRFVFDHHDLAPELYLSRYSISTPH